MKEIPNYKNYFADKLGNIFKLVGSEYIKLKAWTGTGGYKFVYVHKSNGEWINKRQHQLVLEAFVGSRPKGNVTCHNNGDKQDNRLCNLRWDSQKENHLDKWRYGDGQSGHLHPRSKVTKEQAIEIIQTKLSSKSRLWGAGKLAKKFGVHRTTIEKIGRMSSWSNDKKFIKEFKDKHPEKAREWLEKYGGKDG